MPDDLTPTPRILVYQDDSSNEPRPETFALARELGAELTFYQNNAGGWQDFCEAINDVDEEERPTLVLASSIRHTLSLGSLVGYLVQEAETVEATEKRTLVIAPSSPAFLFDQRLKVPDDAPSSLVELEQLIAESQTVPKRTTRVDARCFAYYTRDAELNQTVFFPFPGDATIRPCLQMWLDSEFVAASVVEGVVKVVPFTVVVPAERSPSPYEPTTSATMMSYFQTEKSEEKVVAIFAAKFVSLEGWLALQDTIQEASRVVDAIVVVALNSPLDALRRPLAPDSKPPKGAQDAWAKDVELQGFFDALQGDHDPSDIEGMVGDFLEDRVEEMGRRIPVTFRFVTKDIVPSIQAGDIQGALIKAGEAIASSTFGATWAFTPAVGMSVEESVGRDEFKRLISRPWDPVSAYDFGVRTRLVYDVVLTKRPYGDDGDLTDEPSTDDFTPNAVLYRIGYRDYRECLSAVRPANIRLISDALTSRYLNPPKAQFENAPTETLNRDNAIGLSFMTYDKEPVGSLARWLGDVYGMARDVSVVWTSVEAPPASLLRLCAAWGAQVVHHTLNDDFAMARNAGFAKLRENPNLKFGGFFDPDEYLDEPAADLRVLRRMADRPGAIGWLLVAHNEKFDGTDSMESRSIRMFDLRRDLWMVGRVHESFAESLEYYNEQIPGKTGIRENRNLPIYNPGLAFSQAKFQVKARRYAELLVAELRERPHHANAWLSLHHNYIAGGWYDLAERAVACAVLCARDRETPPTYFAGLLMLNKAKAVLRSAYEKTTPNAPTYRAQHGVSAHLSAIPDFQAPTLEGDPYPPFPEDAEAALLEMGGDYPLILMTGDDVQAALLGDHGEEVEGESP